MLVQQNKDLQVLLAGMTGALAAIGCSMQEGSAGHRTMLAWVRY
jgi:F0F1-type ATP synthase membrane subunit c/vacuolar-type H+-ATPase subunit K